MKLDLFKLNNFNRLDLDDDFTISEEYYQNTEIRSIKNLHIKGIIRIELDEIMADIIVTGTFVLPCAITLEDVEYNFETNIDDSIGNFEDFYNNNKNSLDILPFIWENIVSEVPMRVIKEGVKSHNISGDGWQLVSGEE